jgi:branched-chain amino acid transport system permease protein
MISSEDLRNSVRTGLIAGAIALTIAMIGMLLSFNGRDVITGQLTLGKLLLYSVPFLAAVIAMRQHPRSAIGQTALRGLVTGVMAGFPVFLLTLIGATWPGIRQAFINVSPALIAVLSYEREPVLTGALILLLLFGLAGLLGAFYTRLPDAPRQALTRGLVWGLGIGVMADTVVNILRQRMDGETIGRLFGQTGMRLIPLFVFVLTIALLDYWWQRDGRERTTSLRHNMTSRQQAGLRWGGWVLLALAVAILPALLGPYLTEIINIVGLYILMGLGLNIAVGLAGLLDLGYVTNFAVGAYIMALLTSTSRFGLEQPISFWLALPICVAAAMLTGFVFALPVLRMRGDYLAITTLGFGEIIRVLARSDWLKAYIGGAQGILQIPNPAIEGPVASGLGAVLSGINGVLGRFNLHILQMGRDGAIRFNEPSQLYFLLIVCCLLMYFISWRLNNSRTGRSWMALREDEDVANAVGINTTITKVIAFTLSAASGGLAGAIFAAKLGSIFPHSFQLLISINVLALIIVGGMGSLPGVVVGAFALVGVPELLREFSEYRLMLYGIALIVMMLLRPEGLWPSEVKKRELARDDDPGGGVAAAISADSGGAR